MIFKLLKHKISKNQLLGFGIANLVGLSIILLGIQIYSDLNPLLTSKDSFIQDEYIILTKNVSTLNTFTGKSPSFSKQEVEKLREQPFIEKVGLFEASHFSVKANIGFVGKQFGITTDMFFESVPNDFVDINPKEWAYNLGDNEIPIIIPRSYLDLYNFGFASGKSLPKISEGLVSSILLDLQLSGNGQTESYKGRIVGFSKRLNTILVPESFLVTTNKKLSRDENAQPLRVIIKVKNSSDPELAQFIQENNYLVDCNQLDTGRARYFLNISVGIVLFIGILISVLACYVLILSIYLLLEKNINSLENLILLGYPNRAIVRPYVLITLGLVGVTTCLALLATYLGRLAYIPLISKLSGEAIAGGLALGTIILAVVLFTAILVFSYLVIARKIKRISAFKR